MLSCRKELIAWMFGVVMTVSFIIGVTMIPKLLDTAEGRYGVASVEAAMGNGEKLRVLRGIASEHKEPQGKGSPTVSVELHSLVPGPAAQGSRIELEAEIAAQMDGENFEYTWILPDGVTSENPLSGQLGNLRAGEPMNLKFSGVSQTSDNRQIHLHVFRKVGGESLGAMVQFNTVDGDKSSAEIRDKSEVLRAAASESSSEKLSAQKPKIMQ